MNILSYIWTAVTWASAVFWLWMLIDCIANEEDKAERISSAVGMIIFPPVGVPLYYFQRYRPRKKGKSHDDTTAS